MTTAKVRIVLETNLPRNPRLSQLNRLNPSSPNQPPTILFLQMLASTIPTIPQFSSPVAQSQVTHCPPTLSTTLSTQLTLPPTQTWPGTPLPSIKTWLWSLKILTQVKSIPPYPVSYSSSPEGTYPYTLVVHVDHQFQPYGPWPDQPTLYPVIYPYTQPALQYTNPGTIEAA